MASHHPGSPSPFLPSRRATLGWALTAAGTCLAPSLAAAAARRQAATPPVTDHRFVVTAFGATGLRADSATRACQAAIDACAASGGGTVLVPPGDYTVGMLQLRDHVTLHVEAGATLFLSQTNSEFPQGRRAMIFAENAAHIGVTGRGTLDGLAQYVFTAMRGLDPEIAVEIEIARAAGVDMRRYYRTGVQTYMFILNDCRDVLLRDISIIHSPLWNVRLNDCDRVHVEGVHIHSDLEKGVNADGIDIVSSRNVTISDCQIETGDDAIVLKAIARDGRPARPTENVTVTNCVLTSSSTPLMIGTETQADIRHVVFSNCVLRNSNKGFGINVQDGATVSDVIFSNLTLETGRRHWNWWGSAEMCKFVLKTRTATSPIGRIRDIVIDTVTAHPRGTSTMIGHADQPLEHIRVSNVEMAMLAEDAVDKRATHALRVEHVRGLRLRDVRIRWAEDVTEPRWASALVLRHVTDVVIDGFTGRQGLTTADVPAMLLDEVHDAMILDARASAGTGRFIHVQGATSRDITVRNARVPPGTRVISFEDATLQRAVDVVP